MFDLIEFTKSSQNLKLLYVEDDKTTQLTTILILEEFFDVIITANDGYDGFEKFKANSVDLILTDINMPRLNGIEMIQKIKEIDNDIPIIVLSAHSEADFILDAIKLGVDRYLMKPIEFSQLMNTLSKSVTNINIKKENINYKKSLESQVRQQKIELENKQALLIQQTKMAAVGEMIDAIAHQWKQPLNAISMQNELLLDEVFQTDMNKESIKEGFETVNKQVEHLVDTIDEFRNFFRLNHNVKIIKIKTILNTVALLLKDELLKSYVNLVVICDENLNIQANENDIKHLLLNLINNAKEEMQKANIPHTKRTITIECLQYNENMTILVQDNGNGIPQEIIDNIFKPHFTTKKDSGGTGIGLYMCKQIVEKYGGDIWVQNTKSGATFTVELHHGC